MYTRKWGWVDFWVRKEKEIELERERERYLNLKKHSRFFLSRVSFISKMGQNRAKMGQIGPKWAKLGQNGPNWAKMGHIGPKWAKIGPFHPLAKEYARVGPRDLALPPHK